MKKNPVREIRWRENVIRAEKRGRGRQNFRRIPWHDRNLWGKRREHVIDGPDLSSNCGSVESPYLILYRYI